MKRYLLTAILALGLGLSASAQQLPKVYDESIDPLAQIDKAVKTASKAGKNVVCQVGGNWCPWCLKFADFIKKDAEISKALDESFVYIHVNYPRKGAPEKLSKRLGNPGRFGFPVFVVLDGSGKVIHIQDSSFLEDGESYDRAKVLRFIRNWTPGAVSGN